MISHLSPVPEWSAQPRPALIRHELSCQRVELGCASSQLESAQTNIEKHAPSLNSKRGHWIDYRKFVPYDLVCNHLESERAMQN